MSFTFPGNDETFPLNEFVSKTACDVFTEICPGSDYDQLKSFDINYEVEVCYEISGCHDLALDPAFSLETSPL